MRDRLASARLLSLRYARIYVQVERVNVAAVAFPRRNFVSEKYQKTSVVPIKYFCHLFLPVMRFYDTLGDKMRSVKILEKLQRLEYVRE